MPSSRTCVAVSVAPELRTAGAMKRDAAGTELLTSQNAFVELTQRMRSYLTVRSLPKDVARALERERKRSGESLNQTVIDLLRSALGLGPEELDNGLGRYAGKWSREDLAEFEAATECFEAIDPEVWS